MALEGIKVIDYSQVIIVPMRARILGNFGADVIHIKTRTRGDYWQSFRMSKLKSHQGLHNDILVHRTESGVFKEKGKLVNPSGLEVAMM